MITEGWSKSQDWANKRKRDEKRETDSGVQSEKIKSKEIATEMSQGAGYRAGEGTDVWEGEKKVFIRILATDLG